MSWFRRPRRRAARIILLDPDGRVLLFRLDPSRDPDGRGYWYLPGGGIRWREAIEAAALRELREETGIRNVTVGPVVGERTGVRFVFAGHAMVQDEWYVAGRMPDPQLAPARRGGGSPAANADRRWWSPAELSAAGEAVHPPDLPDLLARAESSLAAPAASSRTGSPPPSAPPSTSPPAAPPPAASPPPTSPPAAK